MILESEYEISFEDIESGDAPVHAFILDKRAKAELEDCYTPFTDFCTRCGMVEANPIHTQSELHRKYGEPKAR